jgi:hypothetical protein
MIFGLKNNVVIAGLLALGAVSSNLQAAGVIFPSAVGSQWRYKVSNGSQYLEKITRSSHHSFTLFYQGGALTYKLRWIKNTQGWTTPNFKALGGLLPMKENFKTHVTGSGGVVLPRTASWKRGYQWNFWYSMRTTGSAGPMTFTQTGKMTVDNTITSMKKIRVPAGSFKCFVVRSDLIFTGIEAVAGQRIPLHVQSREIQYYALGVGLVKRKTNKATTVLVKFTPGK